MSGRACGTRQQVKRLGRRGRRIAQAAATKQQIHVYKRPRAKQLSFRTPLPVPTPLLALPEPRRVPSW
eukprot:5911821-Pyramimonas_sp.AAC.1